MAKLLRDFVKVQNDFTIIPNDILRNKEMKSSVKNILLTMFSLPPEWDFSISGIAAVVTESRDTVQKALVELEKVGYITRKRDRKENGTLGAMIYTIHQFPVSKEDNTYKKNFENQDGKEPIQEKTNIGKKPTLDFQSQLRTDNKLNIDNELSTNDELNTDKYAFPDKSEKVEDIYAFFPEEKQVKSRYIPEDYTEEQLIEHIEPVIRKRINKQYDGEYNKEELSDTLIEIIRIFYNKYFNVFGKRHRILSDMAYENIADEFMYPPIIMSEESDKYNISSYVKMMNVYFTTEYNKRKKYSKDIELSISHFMSENIRSNLYYRTRNLEE